VLGSRRRRGLAAAHRRRAGRPRHPALTRNTRLPTVRRAHRVHFPPLLRRAPPVSPSTGQLATPLLFRRPKPPACDTGDGAAHRHDRPPKHRPLPETRVSAPAGLAATFVGPSSPRNPHRRWALRPWL
jgi:hypothetical protein